MPYSKHLIHNRKNTGMAAHHLRKVLDQVASQPQMEEGHRQRVIAAIQDALNLLMASVDYNDDGSVLGIVGEYEGMESPCRALNPTPTPEWVWVQLLDALHADNGGPFTASTQDFREARPAIAAMINIGGYFRNSNFGLGGDIWEAAAGEEGEAIERFASRAEDYAKLSKILNRIFERSIGAPPRLVIDISGGAVKSVTADTEVDVLFITNHPVEVREFINGPGNGACLVPPSEDMADPHAYQRWRSQEDPDLCEHYFEQLKHEG